MLALSLTSQAETIETTLNVVVISSPDSKERPPSRLFFKNGKKIQEIQISNLHERQALAYKGQKEIVFFTAKQKAKRKVFATVELLTSEQNLVVLAPKAAEAPEDDNKENNAEVNEVSYCGYVVDGNTETFPVGSRYLVNGVNCKIRGELGAMPFTPKSAENTTFEIETQKGCVLMSPKKDGKDSQAMGILLEKWENEKWVQLKSSSWFHSSTSRKIVVFISSNNGNTLTKTISQIMPK